MAARAPFGRLHAIDFLHVLNALAIPLIVEGRKMMHGALPLLVNVRVAAFAGLRLQKIVGRNVFSVDGLRRAGKEFSVRTVAFVFHRGGRKRSDAQTTVTSPIDTAGPP